MKKNKITMDKYKSGVKVLFDAGVDLFVPYEISVPYPPLLVNKVNHHIQCSMDKIEYTKDGKEDCNPVGYYLYPRSSMATKTPLTLANSVGIIDSGYRGDIIAAVHCARQPPVIGSGCQTYNIEKSQRLVQLCPPDLSFPIEVVIVNEPDMLGSGGERGKGGFGSTGS
jgi:dUTP pyrophosphatase